ncbi:putative methionyl-tRNA synthetase [Hordeum vulgare]|nr:putative methionyl-tRNA synthetase [Hordeum vulgare]
MRNRNTDIYWRRIKLAFDEHKLVDLDFANIHMERGNKAMSNHWVTIQTACNKWHGIIEEVIARPKNGANIEGRMVRMFGMYRQDNNDQEFKFLHVFSRIESCEK